MGTRDVHSRHATAALRALSVAWLCCSLAHGFCTSFPSLWLHKSSQLAVRDWYSCERKHQRVTVRCSDEGTGGEEVSIGWKLKKDDEEQVLQPGVMPCIPVPSRARLAAPGQLREVHLYDSSNLFVHSYAMKHTGGYYVQVLQDEEALKDRKFRLCEYGTLCKIVGYRQGIHRNKYAERSDSIRASVMAVGRVQVGDVVQVEPCVAARFSPPSRATKETHNEARVAAAPFEYLEAVTAESPETIKLEAVFSQCAQALEALGEQGVQGSRFDGLASMWSDVNQDSDDESTSSPRKATTLAMIVDRISAIVAADGRRTRPGTPQSIGPTVPFLLPHPVQPGERASLFALAATALLTPEGRAEVEAMEGGPQVLASVRERLEGVLSELTKLQQP